MIRIAALLGVSPFYLIYLGKTLILKRQGITVNLLGDKANLNEKYFDIVLRIMTGIGGVIQFLAAFLIEVNGTGWRYVGLGQIFLGVLILFIAVRAMGLAIVFPNMLMILTALLAIILFDQQIWGEEKYLVTTFGEDYRNYCLKVRRYF